MDRDDVVLRVLIVSIIAIICIPITSCVNSYRRMPMVASQFNVKYDDLRVFIETTDYSLHDFESSEAVRNNFKLWQEGKISIAQKTTVVPMVIPISSGR